MNSGRRITVQAAAYRNHRYLNRGVGPRGEIPTRFFAAREAAIGRVAAYSVTATCPHLANAASRPIRRPTHRNLAKCRALGRSPSPSHRILSPGGGQLRGSSVKEITERYHDTA
jgi:hypothetical protein